MLKTLVLTAAIGSALIGSAARAAPYAGPVAVVVSIPIPPGLPRDTIEALFRRQAPVFAALPDLKQKYFTINEEAHRAGGIYLWTSAAAAKEFYNDAWQARVKATYGAQPEISWFDAPVIIQGKAGMTP